MWYLCAQTFAGQSLFRLIGRGLSLVRVVRVVSIHWLCPLKQSAILGWSVAGGPSPWSLFRNTLDL